MKEISYFMARVKSKLLREKHKESIVKYFRRQGISIGENTNICSNIVTTESHLISIGCNVTISSHVDLITHDNSISKVLSGTTDLFGNITIGDNCFIGAHSIIMYGVTLAPNIIVAAGSVVTKSFQESNIIVGGIPARKISTWQEFGEKNKELAWNLDIISKVEKIRLQQMGEKLVKR